MSEQINNILESFCIPHGKLLKEFEVACIYKITSPSGKVYIGKTINLRQRVWKYRIGYCEPQVALNRSFVKYGIQKHIIEIVHLLPNDVSNEIMNTYEILYISQYKSCGFRLLNLTNGGEGLFGKKHSEETILKMKKSSEGRTFSDLARSNSIKFHKGRKMPEEQRKKIGLSNSGKKLTPEHIEKLKARVGEKRSEEARKRMSDSHKGKSPWNKGLSVYKMK